ncbi:protein phosphatase 2C domain-containing protein [Streptomyces sp. NPDC056944]|uniref:protein phosphatase 2C domain-containing protein n=1 Tax=Streptomyces sp. NPDC056944 TaxID=3345972 RepID=UPI003642F952
MTQQGDNWWDKLYDESAPDTAPTVSGDTLDDHFDTTPRAVPGRVPAQDPSPPGPAAPHATATPPAPRPPSTPPPPTPPAAPAPPADPPVPAPPTRPVSPPPAAPAAASPPVAPAPPAPPTPPAPLAPPEASAPTVRPVSGGATAPPVPPTAPAPSAPREPLAPTVPPAAVLPGPPPTPPASGEAAAPPATGHGPVPPAPRQAPAVSGPAPWEVPEGAGPRTFAAPPPPVDPVVETPTVQVPREPEPEGLGAHDLTVEVSVPRPRTGFVGSRPPTYEPEPTALPVARPGELAELVADTVLDGARYGTCTLRAASVRGDSARFRGEPRRDALLTARFGHDETALVLVAVAAGSRAAEDAHLAAADACHWIAEAVCRSHARLSEDIRSGRRGDLKSGLHRLTDRTYGKLRTRAAERGLAPDEYTATLRCLLVPADPECRTRVFFGIGGGGLFRLRDGSWQDLEPLLPEPAAVTGAPVVGFGSPPPVQEATEEGDRLTMDLGITTAPPLVEDPVPPPAEPFRFRASVARAGDTLLLASPGLAEPMRGEPALAHELAARWADAEPPGLAAFLADTQLRVTGYADDRTGVAVWEA